MVYILYIFLLICSCYYSDLAQKKKKMRYLIIPILMLSFIGGFRGTNVGIDTKNYYAMFDLISSGQMGFVFGVEYGFMKLVDLLSIVVDNSYIFFFFALVTNGLILLRFWDFREEAKIYMMTLTYFISFYFMTMNVMRQFLAIAIIFYFSRLLPKKKYLAFSIVLILASVIFHQSALIGFLYLVFELFKWKLLDKKQKLMLGIGCILSPIFFTLILTKTMKYFERYFVFQDVTFGVMIPIKITVVIFLTLYIKSFKIYLRTKGDNRETYQSSLVPGYYLIGMLISSIGYLYPFMDRIGWYFYIYEGVYWGKTVDNKKVKNFALLCACLLFGYTLLQDMVNGAQGVIPYSFCWFD